MAMKTLTARTSNSRVGLCDTCGICAQRRHIPSPLVDDRSQVEAKVRSVVASVLRDVELYGIDGLQTQSEKAMIPIGVSARHIHVCTQDLEQLFGPGYTLTHERDLLQPGEFASKEMVTLVGAGGKIMPRVRILGPLRSRTQVELARSDGIALGIRNLPMRRSGELDGAAPLTLVGPYGTISLPEVAIRSNRHIHMGQEDASRFGVKQNDVVQLRIGGAEGVTFHNVQIRIHDTWKLVVHLDTDDANAAGIVCEVSGELLK
jgi:putative phosphotransacetylase